MLQQTGELLKLNGQQISADTFEDTNGSSMTQDTVVVLKNGETLTLSQMLK